MPVTSRPSLASRTVPRNSSVAPLALLPTRSIMRAMSIGPSMIAEYTSASRNWRNQGDFVAFAELAIARRVLLVDRDHRRTRESRGIAERADMIDHISHRRAGFDIELDLGLADGVRVRRKEQNGYCHGTWLHPTSMRRDRKAFPGS